MSLFPLYQVYGLLDTPLLLEELGRLVGPSKRLRALAHETHFAQFSDMTGGRWGRFFKSLGAVPATARNFYRLLRSGEPVLLFPGGSIEVCRRRGQKNVLLWQDATDFVRPAARLNAIIVPFSSAGADDAVDLIVDGQEMQRLPIVGPALTQLLKDNDFDPQQFVHFSSSWVWRQSRFERTNQRTNKYVHLVWCFLLSILPSRSVMPLGTLPKPGRFRFEFHTPILTNDVDSNDSEACAKVYRDIKSTVQAGMTSLSSSAGTPAADAAAARAPLPSLRARLASGMTKVLDDLMPL